MPPLQRSLIHCTKKPGLAQKRAQADVQALRPMHTAPVCTDGHTHLHTQTCATYRTYSDTHATLCTYRSTQTTHPHMHRWLHMMFTHYRQIIIDFPAFPVTTRWWDSPRGLPFNALINLKNILGIQSMSLFQMSQAWPSLRPRMEAGPSGRGRGARKGEQLPLHPGEAERSPGGLMPSLAGKAGLKIWADPDSKNAPRPQTGRGPSAASLAELSGPACTPQQTGSSVPARPSGLLSDCTAVLGSRPDLELPFMSPTV